MAEKPDSPGDVEIGGPHAGRGPSPSRPEGAGGRPERPGLERPVRKLRRTAPGPGEEGAERAGPNGEEEPRGMARNGEEEPRGMAGNNEKETREEAGLEDREDIRDGDEESGSPVKEADGEKTGPGAGRDAESKRKDKKEKESPRKIALGIVKDVAISAGIVGGLLLVLYLFSGVWPPMVVIESSSMMHGDDSALGVIDTGDLTLVQKVDERSDIITYVEATCRTNPHYGFKEYGDYGHVIVYRKNGKAETPVIHRAIAWIEYNASASDRTRRMFRGDLPDIGVYNVSEYYVSVTSYRTENYLKQERLVIQVSAILARTTTTGVPHSGFVTKGDHNIPYVDQWVLYLQGGVPVEPVKVEWIVGKAQGELPWFGLFKLWITGHDSRLFPKSSVQSLIITVIILVIVPIMIDYSWARLKKKKQARKDVRKDQFK